MFRFTVFLTAVWIAATLSFGADLPRGAVALEAAELPRDFRLHVELSVPAEAKVRLAPRFAVNLSEAVAHDLAVERSVKGLPVLRVWADGVLVRGPEEVAALAAADGREFPDAGLDFGGDFTAAVAFQSSGDGTLFAMCAPEGKWSPDAKALFIRNGHLVYDVGWRGAMQGGPRVDDGKPHTVLLRQRNRQLELWLDGEKIAEHPGLTRPDAAGHVFKIARAAPDFGGDLATGEISRLQVWSRALPERDLARLFERDGAGANTPEFAYVSDEQAARPAIEIVAGVEVKAAWVQPLERADHAAIVGSWNEISLAEGRQIYTSLCVVCHGTKDQPGSLPTATDFTRGELKNGSDPYSMYATLTEGFGQMVAQPQYTTAQKYAVIQYIREEFFRPHNTEEFIPVTDAYLTRLPKGAALAEVELEDRSLPPYQRMDLGPALFWTYGIEPENNARKGLAIRLDEGPGGISKGRAWMAYDHDTLRVAAATTGTFIDWKDIAFDGSHGTHPTLTGERHLVNPYAPGWASPEGDWNDPRPLGKDGVPYGPLPREWARFEGLYHHGDKLVIAASIGGTRVLESPGWVDYGSTPVFTRTLNVAQAAKPLLLRVAPVAVNVVLAGDGVLRKTEGHWVAELPSGARSRLFISRSDPESLTALAATAQDPLDLEPFTQGSPPRWPQEVITHSEAGADDGAFIADHFPLPVDNPWQSWLRPGGFDFTPDGKAAVVAMWNGDVWRVDGIMNEAPSPLRWKRIASGLFQPLGVKFRGDDLFVTCRDQLARLRDLNDDGEIDYIECYNNDHQVTEHFHEFAMGLQTDEEGNFYYAKSGRHALDSVVPHHGTLLRISADGRHTEILATGFRAANGVCLNDDGTFFITDQEGFWTPKNRINRVRTEGFYGNMYGYSAVTDSSDEAMEPPMVWITNDKDRSPAELVWVPQGAWGSLGGSLLNLSYGTGRAFVVPHEEVNGSWQGAVCELPLPAFATGIMRGRFGSDGALYTAGLFAWAGNATSPGGFHRIRHSGRASHLPLAVNAATGRLHLRLSDPVDPESVTPAAISLTVWSLKRTANYGSPHFDERVLPITAAQVSADGRLLELTIPQLTPTDSYELILKLRTVDGEPLTRSLHGTIHQLAD